MTFYDVYLVSDFTCETTAAIARAVFDNFSNITIQTHLWPLVKDRERVDELIAHIKRSPGIVMCTIFNEDLQNYLLEECEKINTMCIPAVSAIIRDLERFFKIKINKQPSQTTGSDAAARIDAIEYTLAHDDGQSIQTLVNADIIIVGVSRTSKSPTSMYLAYRCFKVANVPFVPNMSRDCFAFLSMLKQNFIVGLTIDLEKLIEFRENRVQSMGYGTPRLNVNTDYVTQEQVALELSESKKFFRVNNWPVLNVTRSSVEETAAKIIRLYNEWKIHDKSNS